MQPFRIRDFVFPIVALIVAGIAAAFALVLDDALEAKLLMALGLFGVVSYFGFWWLRHLLLFRQRRYAFPKPGQVMVIGEIWDMYGGRGSPPTVVWLPATHSSGRNTTEKDAIRDTIGRLVGGYTVSSRTVVCAWPDWWYAKLSDTAFAHELLHAAKLSQRGELGGDADHSDDDWALVGKVNDMLEKRGL